MLKKFKTVFVAALAAVCLGAGVGAFTAQPVSAEAANADACFKSASVSLEKDVTVRYYLTVPEGYTAAKMTFAVGEGTEAAASLKTGLQAGETVTFDCEGLTAYDMTKNITASVTFMETEAEGAAQITGVKNDFSVAAYCSALLKDFAALEDGGVDTQAKYDALKTLVSNLLAYGDTAQAYFGKTVDSTAELTVAQKNALLTADVTATDFALTGETYTGLGWTGATLRFGNTLDLVYKFKTTAEVAALGTLGVKVNGKFVAAELESQADDYAAYYPLSVTDIDEVLSARVAYKSGETVTEIGKTASYSVKSYVYAMLQNSESEQMKALASAAYAYGVAAKAYTAELKNTASTFESIGATLEKGETLSTSITKIDGYNSSLFGGGQYCYHFASDGTYLYVVAGTNASSVKISRYDLTAKTVVANSEAVALNSEQNVAMFVKDGYVYLYTASGFKKLATGFASGTAFEAANLSFGSLTEYQGVAYDSAKGWVVLSQNVLYYYDDNFNQTASVSVPVTQTSKRFDGSSVSAGNIVKDSGKRLFADGNYVYVHYWGGNSVTPTIIAYDWTGARIGSVLIPNSVHERTGNGQHLESITLVGDDLYFGICGWQNGPGGSAIFKTTLGVENNVSVQVGEAYEMNGDLMLAESSYSKISGNGAAGGYVHGFAVDGAFGYAAFTTGQKGSLKINLVKFALADGASVGYAIADLAELTDVDPWSINQEIFVYGDNVYLSCWNNGKIYSVGKNAFTAEGTAMTETTGFFGGITTAANGVAYSEERGEFAVRSGNKLYVGKKDSLTLVNGSLASATTYAGLYADDNYIYVLAENARGEADTLAVAIYDWEGNAVTDGYYSSLTVFSAGSSNNIQGMATKNGNVYFLVCQWGNGATGTGITSGGFIVSGKLNLANNA